MEREDERGLAHFLEHMAFKGSQNLPANDLVQYLQRLGMAFGADTNASTSFDSTVYKLELPSNAPDLLDRSLLVLREKADQLLIPAAELDKERGVILSEKRLRDTPAIARTSPVWTSCCRSCAPPNVGPSALDEVVATAPRERMLDFYRRYYTPSRITIVAVGAIDPAQLRPADPQALRRLPCTATPRRKTRARAPRAARPGSAPALRGGGTHQRIPVGGEALPDRAGHARTAGERSTCTWPTR